jgi:hypothetical protein
MMPTIIVVTMKAYCAIAITWLTETRPLSLEPIIRMLALTKYDRGARV